MGLPATRAFIFILLLEKLHARSGTEWAGTSCARRENPSLVTCNSHRVTRPGSDQEQNRTGHGNVRGGL